jgi:hypothetical protein
MELMLTINGFAAFYKIIVTAFLEDITCLEEPVLGKGLFGSFDVVDIPSRTIS